MLGLTGTLAVCRRPTWQATVFARVPHSFSTGRLELQRIASAGTCTLERRESTLVLSSNSAAEEASLIAAQVAAAFSAPWLPAVFLAPCFFVLDLKKCWVHGACIVHWAEVLVVHVAIEEFWVRFWVRTWQCGELARRVLLRMLAQVVNLPEGGVVLPLAHHQFLVGLLFLEQQPAPTQAVLDGLIAQDLASSAALVRCTHNPSTAVLERPSHAWAAACRTTMPRHQPQNGVSSVK